MDKPDRRTAMKFAGAAGATLTFSTIAAAAENAPVEDLAYQLVDAENLGRDGGKEAADEILAADFLGITRSRPGAAQEQNRQELLETIGSAEPNNPLRKLDFADPDSGAWRVGDGCWVVKGVVTTDSGSFRNIYVFKQQDERWRLFAWQVTGLG